MARAGRYFLPDQPLHVIQRGNSRGAVFFCDDDHARYRDWLAEAADDYGCLVHAYVLMTNHVHLLVTPRHEDSLPRTMQSLGRRVAQSQVNRVSDSQPVGDPLRVHAVARPRIVARMHDHAGAHRIEFDITAACEEISLAVDRGRAIASLP